MLSNPSPIGFQTVDGRWVIRLSCHKETFKRSNVSHSLLTQGGCFTETSSHRFWHKSPLLKNSSKRTSASQHSGILWSVMRKSSVCQMTNSFHFSTHSSDVVFSLPSMCWDFLEELTLSSKNGILWFGMLGAFWIQWSNTFWKWRQTFKHHSPSYHIWTNTWFASTNHFCTTYSRVSVFVSHVHHRHMKWGAWDRRLLFCSTKTLFKQSISPTMLTLKRVWHSDNPTKNERKNHHNNKSGVERRNSENQRGRNSSQRIDLSFDDE